MKIAEKCKVFVAGALVAALAAGMSMPALAATVTGYPSIASVEQQNDAITPEQVEDMIRQIAPVTLESETAILNAQAAYDSMPAEWQAMVSNYEALEIDKQALEDLQVDALAEKLNNTVYREHDDVENADFFFWKDYPKTNQSIFALPYFCMSDNEVQPLRMMYTYYGKHWIFWNQIVYSVDGEVYKKDVDRSLKSEKVVRVIFSNDVDVWELGDDVADPQEIDMLKKSVTGQKVVFRFKGDSTKYDLNMSASAYKNFKTAISNVLDAYESLKSASPSVRARALEKVEAHKQNSKFINLAY